MRDKIILKRVAFGWQFELNHSLVGVIGSVKKSFQSSWIKLNKNQIKLKKSAECRWAVSRVRYENKKKTENSFLNWLNLKVNVETVHTCKVAGACNITEIMAARPICVFVYNQRYNTRIITFLITFAVREMSSKCVPLYLVKWETHQIELFSRLINSANFITVKWTGAGIVMMLNWRLLWISLAESYLWWIERFTHALFEETFIGVTAEFVFELFSLFGFAGMVEVLNWKWSLLRQIILMVLSLPPTRERII